MAGNLLKMIPVLESLQQTENLKMLNACEHVKPQIIVSWIRKQFVNAKDNAGCIQLFFNHSNAHSTCLLEVIFDKISHHLVLSLSPPCLILYNSWIFLKWKSPQKGERFQTVGEIIKNVTRQLMVNSYYFEKWERFWEKCKRVSWRELRYHCIRYATFSLILNG